MGTNECNLELQLQPSHLIPQQPADDDSISQSRVPQQLTIFYNGQVCVSNVTELQARAILMLAKREMTSPCRGSSTTSPDNQDEDDSDISPPKGRYSRAARPQNQMPCPAPALSMKRSLQRFLQKRRHRVLATNPYNVR